MWTNLNPLHPRMLCAKFSWNWLSGSREDGNVKSLRTDRQTTDERWSEKLTWAFSSGELKIHYRLLDKLEPPSPKDALCQVWLVLEKILRFHQCNFTISLLSPLGKGWGLSLWIIWSPFTQICFVLSVYLKLANWFWRRKQKCEKFQQQWQQRQQGQQIVIKKAYLGLQLGWAKKCWPKCAVHMVWNEQLPACHLWLKFCSGNLKTLVRSPTWQLDIFQFPILFPIFMSTI